MAAFMKPVNQAGQKTKRGGGSTTTQVRGMTIILERMANGKKFKAIVKKKKNSETSAIFFDKTVKGLMRKIEKHLESLENKDE